MCIRISRNDLRHLDRPGDRLELASLCVNLCLVSRAAKVRGPRRQQTKRYFRSAQPDGHDLVCRILFGISPREQMRVEDLHGHATRICEAFSTASETLPTQITGARKPWISAQTMGLIEHRNFCRTAGQHTAEKELNKEIRAAARRDRRAWLDDSLASGSWSAIRRLRQGKPKKHTTIQDQNGTFVSTAERADTLADYFEKVQWRCPLPSVASPSRPALGPSLDVDTSSFRLLELQTLLRKLKHGKASGGDGIPPDFWKALSKMKVLALNNWNYASTVGTKSLCRLPDEMPLLRLLHRGWPKGFTPRTYMKRT